MTPLVGLPLRVQCQVEVRQPALLIANAKKAEQAKWREGCIPVVHWHSQDLPPPRMPPMSPGLGRVKPNTQTGFSVGFGTKTPPFPFFEIFISITFFFLHLFPLIFLFFFMFHDFGFSMFFNCFWRCFCLFHVLKAFFICFSSLFHFYFLNWLKPLHTCEHVAVNSMMA